MFAFAFKTLFMEVRIFLLVLYCLNESHKLVTGYKFKLKHAFLEDQFNNIYDIFIFLIKCK